LELAYEAEVRCTTVDEILATLLVEPEYFAVELLRAAEAERDKADALIEQHAKGWTLARMAMLDRLVMRLAVAEMLTATTPTGVILSEAVELVGRYSTEESSRFVNGVLAAIARQIRAAETKN
jgi:N utilization substance protein B